MQCVAPHSRWVIYKAGPLLWTCFSCFIYKVESLFRKKDSSYFYMGLNSQSATVFQAELMPTPTFRSREVVLLSFCWFGCSGARSVHAGVDAYADVPVCMLQRQLFCWYVLRLFGWRSCQLVWRAASRSTSAAAWRLADLAEACGGGSRARSRRMPCLRWLIEPIVMTSSGVCSF